MNPTLQQHLEHICTEKFMDHNSYDYRWKMDKHRFEKLLALVTERDQEAFNAGADEVVKEIRKLGTPQVAGDWEMLVVGQKNIDQALTTVRKGK